MRTTLSRLFNLRTLIILLAALWSMTSIAVEDNKDIVLAQADTTVLSAPKAQSNMPPVLIPPAPSINVKGYVLMDAQSGKILAEKDMNKRLPPASLTKLMTLYLIAQALERGQITLDDKVRISKRAWSHGGSRMFLKLGSSVPVKDLVEGIIVASGNDATVAMAEYIGGNEKSFAELMNQTAKQLGMKNTHYTDATGLPHPQHYSTPYDLAVLARAMIQHYPQYYYWFKQKWIKWNGIRQPNRNRLLWRSPYVDGLKTGHTNAAGYCLISSGKNHGMRLVSVVMGAPSDSARSNDSQALLNWGFRFFNTQKIFSGNTTLATPRVWLGKRKRIQLGLTSDLYITAPVGTLKNLRAVMSLDPKLSAPIYKGQQYGVVKVMINKKVIAQAPLIALTADPKGGMWTRFSDRILMFFSGWFS